MYEYIDLRTGDRTLYDNADWAAFCLGVDTDEMLWALDEYGECATDTAMVRER